ncbi:MAG: AMP-binding protein, partial [Akkermansia sp.]|nr:AMP-binding protein [Akkermansia sp.]
MATVRIHGAEERPSQPSFYILNRVDEVSLPAIIKAMGGAENVAFMVEEVLIPSEAVMKVVQESGSKVLSFNFRKSDSRTLREQLMQLMQEGLDVLYLPGRPNSIIGTISDVPMPFMMQLGALHIAPVPVFVGGFRNHVSRAFTAGLDYDWVTVDFLPKMQSGPQTGERLLEIWMEACYKRYDENPAFEKSLPRVLVENLKKHASVELVDGLDGSSLPYGKMLGVAMALARWFKKNVKESRLGIILPPGKGGVIANIACFLAGIVPVNINYTSSESAFESIVRQGGLKHFVTARAFMSKLPQFPWPKGETIIHLDKTLKGLGMAKIASWVAFAKFAPVSVIAKTFNLDARCKDDEAALLFTSGSSGEPKGVPLTHKMILSNTAQLLSKAWVPAGSPILCSLPIFHSLGLSFTTIMPMIYGFSMVTYPSPLDAKNLNDLIEKHKCTIVLSTPTFARSMLRRAHADTYKSVKYFVVGAEKLQETLANEFIEKCGVQLLEGYGLTETTPLCGVNLDRIGPTAEQPYYVPGEKKGTIGQLVPGLAVRITDPDNDDVRLPLSEQGMIWFKGPNVFSGYIGRDDLNAEIFRDGWFKTGDLGFVDLNGFLTLGGRRSRFSKVGGEMVPHEVVENAIEDFVEIPEGFTGRAVAVMGVPDAAKGEA